MKQRALALLIAAACGLTTAAYVTGQTSEELKPGQTFPKPNYFPDPNKVVYVIFWHHKKRVNEFGFQDYFMDADGVNDTTAQKMVKLMEKRYPNLVVYKKEINERDVEALVQRERKRIKFIDKDWVDVKQPAKIQLPQKVGDKKYDYSKLVLDESAPKGNNRKLEGKGKNLKLEGTVWRSVAAKGTVSGFRFQKGNTFVWVGEDGTEIKMTWKRVGNKVYIDWAPKQQVTGTIGADGKMTVESRTEGKLDWTGTWVLKK
jgi:hypothetical protein